MKGVNVEELLKEADRNGVTYTVTPTASAKLLAATHAPTKGHKGKRKSKRKGKGKPQHHFPLVAEAFIAPATWVLPIPTASEINLRDWRARSRRSDVAWKVVSRCFGRQLDYLSHIARHYHAGRPIDVKLTRLATKRLDNSNVPPALKAAEDAVAFLLGADDGDARWQSSFHQEVGYVIGVRVELAPM